jgi:dihydroorotate dehydrogenase electron transfer subunit
LYIEKARVDSIQTLVPNTFLLEVFSPLIASKIKPGQFCNIKVSETDYPLLRRPFSICRVDGDNLHFMFDVHGEGTKLLSSKIIGDEIDILGPLGKGFNYNEDYKTAIIIAGGIGAAPFPYLIESIPKDKEVYCFIGGRSRDNIIEYGMKNISVSTDDGSLGFKGTIVDLFKKEFGKFRKDSVRIFACGPNPMLKALQQFTIAQNLDCQISTECAMACGFGICQGCPIDNADGDGYYLVCKDGPVFDARMVRL